MNDATLPGRLLGARAAVRLQTIGITVPGEPGDGLHPRDLASATRYAANIRTDRLDFAALRMLWSGLSISVEPLANAGYLLDFGTEAEIVVRQDDVEPRQRFTWAHEIGHWLIAQQHESLGPRQSSPELVGLERWCDRYATNLLIPPRLCAFAVNTPTDEMLRVVMEAPLRFGVSPHAAFRQLSEINSLAIAHYSPSRRPAIRLFGISSLDAKTVAFLAEVSSTSRRYAVAKIETRLGMLAVSRRPGTNEVVGLIEQGSE